MDSNFQLISQCNFNINTINCSPVLCSLVVIPFSSQMLFMFSLLRFYLVGSGVLVNGWTLDQEVHGSIPRAEGKD